MFLLINNFVIKQVCNQKGADQVALKGYAGLRE
jgi:hypothetical protein